MPGCPYTRIAAAPFPAPAAYSSTRLLPRIGDEQICRSGPIARPAGAFNEDALTAAEAALVKSTCPITASGAIRPLWFTGRGKRRTRLLPESATYSVPSIG